MSTTDQPQAAPAVASFDVVVALPLDEAEALAREALTEQGFGVLTEIDVAATLRAKLGVERPPLKILGACNPALSHQALETDPSIALMLPCNVVVEEAPGGTRVRFVDPRVLMPGPDFATIASEAAERLEAAAATVSSKGGTG